MWWWISNCIITNYKDAFGILGVFDENLIFVNDMKKKKDNDYDCDELCSLTAVIYGISSD